MENFREITPYELHSNVFDSIGNAWMLVGGEKDGKVNMMTASWGGMGILWSKPVAFVFIRPQRYTKEFVDAAETFSLNFLPEQYRGQLTTCGSKSGRDIDKVKVCGFTVHSEMSAPIFEEADTALVCQKLYRQTIEPAGFIKRDLETTNYPGKDFHHMYVAEIVKVYVKK